MESPEDPDRSIRDRGNMESNSTPRTTRPDTPAVTTNLLTSPQPRVLVAPQVVQLDRAPSSRHSGIPVVSANVSTGYQREGEMTFSPATTPTSVPPTEATSPSSTDPQQPNPRTWQPSKEKCKNFLINILAISKNKSKCVERKVRMLVQDLINAKLQPQEFSEQLFEILKSTSPPLLTEFLKACLPELRQAMCRQEISIPDINPPPLEVAYSLPAGAVPLPMPFPPGSFIAAREGFPGPAYGRLVYPDVLPVVASRPSSPIPFELDPSQYEDEEGYDYDSDQMPYRVAPYSPRPAAPVPYRMMPLWSLIQQRTCMQPPWISPLVLPPMQFVQMQTAYESPPPYQFANYGMPAPPTLTCQPGKHVYYCPENPMNNPVGPPRPMPPGAMPQFRRNPEQSEMMDEQVAPPPHAYYADMPAIDEVDFNDLAAIVNLNLREEAESASSFGSSDTTSTQTTYCDPNERPYTDDTSPQKMYERVKVITNKHKLGDPTPEVMALINHAVQERLKNWLEKFAVLARFRFQTIINKNNLECIVSQDIDSQLRILDEVDVARMRRRGAEVREMLFRDKRSTTGQSEQETHQAEDNGEMTYGQADTAANASESEASAPESETSGPESEASASNINAGGEATDGSVPSTSRATDGAASGEPPQRPTRMARLTLRDLLFLVENDREVARATVSHYTNMK